jgi:hypothetical protein
LLKTLTLPSTFPFKNISLTISSLHIPWLENPMTNPRSLLISNDGINLHSLHDPFLNLAKSTPTGPDFGQLGKFYPEMGKQRGFVLECGEVEEESSGGVGQVGQEVGS